MGAAPGAAIAHLFGMTMSTVRLTLIITFFLSLGLASGGCMLEEDFDDTARAVSDEADAFYEKVRRMNCLEDDKGKEKSCTSNSDCPGNACDQNCGCCVATPPALTESHYCRYLILACEKGSSGKVVHGYMDRTGEWHTVEGDPDVDVEEESPANMSTSEGDGASGEDELVGCHCPEARASTGHGYFGKCLDDATKTTTKNCQYPPTASGDCPDEPYCVYEMKVKKSKCCDPTDSNCTVPSTYSKSECGGKSCQGNQVVSCDMGGGTWVKKADCGKLALPKAP